jgi:hypothetical protein
MGMPMGEELRMCPFGKISSDELSALVVVRRAITINAIAHELSKRLVI